MRRSGKMKDGEGAADKKSLERKEERMTGQYFT